MNTSHKKPRLNCYLLTAIVLLSACATTDANRTRAEGTGTGLVVGAFLGALIGGDAKSAAIGAAIGGAIGAGYAESIVKKKEDYVKQEDYLNDVVRQAELVRNKVAEDNQQLAAEISILEQSNQITRTTIENSKEEKRRLKKQQNELASMIKQSERMLNRVNQELEFQNQVLLEEQDSQHQALVIQVAQEVNGLNDTKNILEQQLAQLRVIDERIAY